MSDQEQQLGREHMVLLYWLNTITSEYMKNKQNKSSVK